jgi:hypothetical protein
MAMMPNTTELAALEMSGLAPPPAPMPFKAPKTPGQVKAVPATMKDAKMVDRYHVTGCLSSRSMAILAELGVVDLGSIDKEKTLFAHGTPAATAAAAEYIRGRVPTGLGTCVRCRHF